MKTRIVYLIIFLIVYFSNNYAQKDTVIYIPDKDVYEIKYWAKSSGIDTFMTVIFIPSNKVVPKIKAKITNRDNTYYYNYKITNTEKTKTPLEQFLLEINSMVQYNNKSTNDWYFGIEQRISGCSWFPLEDLLQNEEKDGFCIESNSLPGIGNAFFQGRTPFYMLSEEESSSFFEESLKKLMRFPDNYVNNKTVIPVYNNDNHSLLDFIDTLTSYCSISYYQNWIITDLVGQKYQHYLTNSKSALQQNKNVLARCYLQDVLRDVDIDSSSSITSEAYALIRYNTEYLISKLPPVTGMIVRLTDSKGEILIGGTLQYYEGSWKNAVNNQDGTFIVNTNQSKVSLRMTYAYGSQTLSNVNVGNDIITFNTINAVVQLKDSQGNLIDRGTVQYYSGAWRDFGSTTNGVATKELLAGNYSFRMTYAYASTDKSQNLDTNSTIVFTTKNTIVELRNSSGQLIDGGEVQYYSGGWRIFGTASGGISQKELLPNTYSFRMTYGYGSNDKQQNTDTNPIVVFNTIKADVELRDSRNNLLDQGVVQYYSGAWRDFGTTVNGVATKELLPNNYSFRMSYAYSSNDKQQNIGVDPTVVFQTVNSIVQLKNSLGNLIDQGTVQYYSGAWRDFGTTINGEVTKELLPNNYSFRMSYAFASNDKQQNIGTTPTVVFQTVNTSVELRNSQNNLMGEGVVQYYSGGWRTFGTTVGGIANLELLPNNYSFRMTHEYIALDKSQNTGTSNVVTFTTVQCRVLVRGNQNQPINNATVRYYAGAWRNFGTTINGEVTRELLPINLTLRAIVGTAQQDKTQNLLTNPLVEFIF